MKLPRPHSSFDSFEDLYDYLNDRDDEAEGEAQDADDRCLEDE